MTQSKIISSTDAMLAIGDAVICDMTVTALKRMHCVASITTLKPHGGMKGSPGDNVWYGRTNFVRTRRYESAFIVE